MSNAGGSGGCDRAGRGGRRVLMPSATRKQNTVSVSSTHSTERRANGGRGETEQSSGSGSHQSHQMAGLYDLEETLGKGHFAVVKAAKHVFTGERVAVKVIDKTKLDGLSQKALGQEILCMKLVQHPHVVRLYEVIETSTKMFLVLELGHGDLYDLILKQQGGLNEQLAKRYFSQIVSAVSYCHTLHVVHRDLKPENVVYFSTGGGQVKLTDFGFSNKFCPGQKLDTSCGSVAYSAPEILLGDAYDAPAVDIWSLGVILFMLVCGRLPFQEANDSETLTMIMDVKYTVPSTISKSCRDLIDKLLVRYPEKRATLEQVQTHPWLANDYLDKETVPLITDHRLTSEERGKIVAEMVEGGIGGSEEITEALQKNAYNHITSTFFLLAEKYLREHGSTKLTHATLTASLESLHERRKSSTAGHSGPSDTDNDVISNASGGEEDSLAPLDLDMRNASAATTLAVKKSFSSCAGSSRLHSVLSASSGLGDLGGDKGLSIVEEASGGVSGDEIVQYSDDEGDDSAGPLPTTTNPRRHYHHHRRIIPQRSASSSEDEDSEKMKRRTTSTKTKTNRSHEVCTAAAALSRRRFFDDESSDEQGAGFQNSGGGKIGSSFRTTASAIVESKCDDNGGGHSTEKTTTSSNGNSELRIDLDDDGDYDDSVRMNGIHRKNNDLDSNSCSSLRLLSVNNSKPSAPSLGLSKSNGYLSDCSHSVIEVVVSSSCTDEDDEFLSPNPKLNNNKLNLVNGGANCDIIDNGQHGNTGNSGSGGSISFVKKGKQFLSWFFLRHNKKKHLNHLNCAGENADGGCGSGSSTNGIYKTKSCTELKLRNCSSGSASGSSAKRNTTDVNQNL